MPIYQKEINALERKAMAKAKKLMKGTEIYLEKDNGCFWVRFPEEDNKNSPIKGEQFCTDGIEVLTAVETILANPI